MTKKGINIPFTKKRLVWGVHKDSVLLSDFLSIPEIVERIVQIEKRITKLEEGD